MLDKAEADAVFALPQGGVSDVLKSQFGPVIVRVKGITPSTIKPFAEVADAGQAAGLRFPRRRQDPGAARQDRGRAGVRQIAHRGRQGGGLDGQSIAAVDAQGAIPKARRSTCRTRPNCCAPPSPPTSGSMKRRSTPRTAASSGSTSPRSIRRTTSHSTRRSPRSRSSGAPRRSTRRSPARRTISSSRSTPAGASPTSAKGAGAEAKSAQDVHRAEQTSLPRSGRRRHLPRSPPTARARRRRRTGGWCSRSLPTDAAGRLRRRPRQGDGVAARHATRDEPARPICRSACAASSASSIHQDVLQSAEGS